MHQEQFDQLVEIESVLEALGLRSVLDHLAIGDEETAEEKMQAIVGGF